MREAIHMSTVAVAGVGLAVALAVGTALRFVFGVLADRAEYTRAMWDDLGWNLLRSLAVPVLAVLGVWWVSTSMGLRASVSSAVNRVLLAAIVLTVAVVVARTAGDLVRNLAAVRSGAAGSATIFVNLARVIIFAIGLLVLLQSLGIPVTPMLTALGVGGLAVALALQGTLANLFAGIQVLASRKVQPGDFVRLDSGEDGYVEDINWRNTTIRQLAGNIIIVLTPASATPS